MDLIDYHLALALAALLAAFFLLRLLIRTLVAPWRLLADRYPGRQERSPPLVSYVMARFRGPTLPFTLTRCIRIRGDRSHLALMVIGLDFLPARLREILIPREAVLECTPCDNLLTRQKLTVKDSPVTVIIYGRGAKVLRNWWGTGSE